jgi:putative transposase
MARKPRIHYPGALYHVILRGNARQDIFFEDADRYRFYLLLQEGTERFGHRIHAFCLMTNHVHLVVQVGDIPLSRIMQNISFRYTRWINRRQSRTGHLFQGRYKALLIDADSYLLELVRYIHLNPMRVGIASAPGDYPWTSHRAYLGMDALPWLETDWILGSFGKRREQARKLYQQFIMDGIAEGHRKEFHNGSSGGRILGEDSFADRVLTIAEKRDTTTATINGILAEVCREYGMDVSLLALKDKQRGPAEARALAAWLVRESSSLSLTDLGKVLNRDVSSLSIAASRLQARAKSETKIVEMMERLRSDLT